jgi:hypothetical protein
MRMGGLIATLTNVLLDDAITLRAGFGPMIPPATISRGALGPSPDRACEGRFEADWRT